MAQLHSSTNHHPSLLTRQFLRHYSAPAETPTTANTTTTATPAQTPSITQSAPQSPSPSLQHQQQQQQQQQKLLELERTVQQFRLKNAKKNTFLLLFLTLLLLLLINNGSNEQNRRKISGLIAQIFPLDQLSPLGSNSDLTNDLSQLIIQYAIEHGLVGGQCSVIRDQETVYDKSFGFSDLENHLPMQNESKIRLFHSFLSSLMVQATESDDDSTLNLHRDQLLSLIQSTVTSPRYQSSSSDDQSSEFTVDLCDTVLENEMELIKNRSRLYSRQSNGQLMNASALLMTDQGETEDYFLSTAHDLCQLGYALLLNKHPLVVEPPKTVPTTVSTITPTVAQEKVQKEEETSQATTQQEATLSQAPPPPVEEENVIVQEVEPVSNLVAETFATSEPAPENEPMNEQVSIDIEHDTPDVFLPPLVPAVEQEQQHQRQQEEEIETIVEPAASETVESSPEEKEETVPMTASNQEVVDEVSISSGEKTPLSDDNLDVVVVPGDAPGETVGDKQDVVTSIRAGKTGNGFTTERLSLAHRKRPVRVVVNNDGSVGSSTVLFMIPEERLVVSIMSNTEGAKLQPLAEMIARETIAYLDRDKIYD